MKILSYNCQRGKKGLGFMKEQLESELDIWCFQRFPEKWLGEVKKSHIYQPSFPGADNGCLTVYTQGKPGKKGFTFERKFSDQSQSTAFIDLQFEKFTLVNQLPPFKEGDVKLEDHVRHLRSLLEDPRPKVIVGDFHVDDWSELNLPLPQGNYKVYSSVKSFRSAKGTTLALTKLLSNIPLSVKERLVSQDTSPQTHNPVLFEIQL